jgi:small-conductance mechanosensitive channel
MTNPPPWPRPCYPRRVPVLLAAALLALPAGAQETAAPEPEPPPIAVGADTVPDAAIAERLRGILDALPELQDVTVSVRSGVVDLGGSVAEAADTARAEALAERIEGVVAVRSEVEAARDVSKRLLPAFDRVENRLRQAAAAVPLLLLSLVVFLAVTGLGLLLSRRWGFYERLAPNAFIANIYRTLIRVGFLVAGIAAMLDVLGATALLGTILGAAGIIGLAVGFGVRDTIENFVASVMLSLRQPFAPNDLVEIEGVTGNVILLNSRATVLLTPDGNHVRLPNSMVFKSKIVNLTREPQRRFVFDLGIDSETDLSAARRVGLAAMRKLPFVLDQPAVTAWIEDVGDSTVIIRFTGWVDQAATDFLTARGEAIRIVKDALEGAGFTLPEPIYRVRLDRRRSLPQDETAPLPPERAETLVPPSAEAAAASASAPKDPTIERKAAADRRSAAATDLLGSGGARE